MCYSCVVNRTTLTFLAGRKMGRFFHLKLKLRKGPNLRGEDVSGGETFSYFDFFLANIS